LHEDSNALITYDGVEPGGYPHLLADMSNTAFTHRVAAEQAILYADVSSDQSIADGSFTTIDIDVQLINPSIYSVVNNEVEFLLPGFYRVMADAKLDGPGTIEFAGLSAELGSREGNLTGVVQVDVNQTNAFQAAGSGGSRTLSGQFTRIQIEYIGAA
jgi:hypothetical protein